MKELRRYSQFRSTQGSSKVEIIYKIHRAIPAWFSQAKTGGDALTEGSRFVYYE